MAPNNDKLKQAAVSNKPITKKNYANFKSINDFFNNPKSRL